MGVSKLNKAKLKSSRLMNSGNGMYNIVEGPDCEALFEACRWVLEPEMKKEVVFRVQLERAVSYDATKIRVDDVPICDWRVLGINHVADSKDVLLIEGDCMADLRFMTHQNPSYRRQRFRAQYDTKLFRGMIVFFEAESSSEDGRMSPVDLAQDTYD